MSNKLNTLHFVGYASGIAAADQGCGDGPNVLQKSSYLADFKNTPWQMVSTSSVLQQSQELAKLTANLTRERKFFVVMGGDHSSAIGTWSGVKQSVKSLGLIWIDAHMDSHTPESSISKNIHGMPLACLLGFGDPALTTLSGDTPVLSAKHVCLIGIRSYEPAEALLLKKLNVRVFMMEEVKQRGLKTILAEAIQIATQGTSGYGISIDIDSMDPHDAPGTGTAEPNGIPADELINALTVVADDTQLIGAEIVEFDPHRDQQQKTEKIIAKLLKSLTGKK